MLVGPLTEDERRQLRGLQDAYLTKQAAKRKRKGWPQKLNKDRRQWLIGRVCEILKHGEPTPFAFEGAARHGLRSSLCLAGWKWSDANAAAADVVSTALNLIGARRPTWQQGQPEHTQPAVVALTRTRCIRCGERLPDAHTKFCSHLCKSSHYAEVKRWDDKAISEALSEAAQLVAAE